MFVTYHSSTGQAMPATNKATVLQKYLTAFAVHMLRAADAPPQHTDTVVQESTI